MLNYHDKHLQLEYDKIRACVERLTFLAWAYGISKIASKHKSIYSILRHGGRKTYEKTRASAFIRRVSEN